MPKSYTSPMQRMVDLILGGTSPTTQPEVADAVIKKGAKRFIANPEGIPNEHPTGVREGSVESLIKTLGARSGSLIDKDQPYLEQYMHPNVDVLPKTNERPQTLRPFNGVDYRSPDYEPLESGYQYANAAGLGHFATEDIPTHSMLPLGDSDVKVHDRWDFDTNAPLTGVPGLDAAIRLVLRKSGQPYAVYGPISRGLNRGTK